MNRITYTLLFYLLSPLVFIRQWWRSLKSPAYRQRWLERLGFYSLQGLDKQTQCVVFHAVSVGEVHACVPLVQQLQQEFPSWKIVLTTSTPTGSARVKEIFADKVLHVYLPYDLPGAVKRFLSFAKPDLMIIMETELWPNLIHYCGLHSCKLMLANARLSAKSLHNYQKVPALTRQMMSGLSAVAAQGVNDGAGFVKLGLESDKLSVTGSMKFDVTIDSAQVEAGKALKESMDGSFVLVAGSTREGEEEKVLAAFEQILKVQPLAVLVLVPRHLERIAELEAQIKAQGFSFAKLDGAGSDFESLLASQPQVLLGATMGEMQFYYSLGDVAFVGGSLVETGCQNIIEPAALGLPVITGPSLFNFLAISEMFVAAGAMRVVADYKQLAEEVLSLRENENEAREMSRSALQVVEANRGATSRIMTLSKQLLSA